MEGERYNCSLNMSFSAESKVMILFVCCLFSQRHLRLPTHKERYYDVYILKSCGCGALNYGWNQIIRNHS